MKREGVEFQRKSQVGNDMANAMLFFLSFLEFCLFPSTFLFSFVRVLYIFVFVLFESDLKPAILE